MQKTAQRQTSRLKKILKHVDKSKPGVEIGPIHNPKAPKRDGYNVHVIDHLSRADLLKKYQHHNIDFDRIEDVDFVWSGESYAELTGHTNYYDWIIATHVIEHTPDFIGFLNNCAEILSDNGIISLSLPDKRFCFDHFRPVTGLGQIIDSHVQKRTVHSEGTVAEFLLHTVTLGNNHSWRPKETGDYRFLHTLDMAKPQIARAAKGIYVDSHAWCFTAASFRLIIRELYELGYISVCEYDFPEPSASGEIYMTLKKGHSIGNAPDRLFLLKEMEAESCDANGAIIRRKACFSKIKKMFGRLQTK